VTLNLVSTKPGAAQLSSVLHPSLIIGAIVVMLVLAGVLLVLRRRGRLS
jgi:hypothetical protein